MTGVRRKVDQRENILKLGPFVCRSRVTFAEDLIDEFPQVADLLATGSAKVETLKIEEFVGKVAG